MRPARKLALVGVAQRLSDRLPERVRRRARDLGKIAVNHRGQRKSAFRHVQYEFARRASPVLAAPFGPGRLLVDARDDEIGRTVYVSGGYERWHMDAAVTALRAAGHDPAGKLFVDVGANIGTSTVDALLQFGFGEAVCFEPAPDNVRLLRMNLLLNDLDGRARVVAFALSDHDGEGALHRSATNSGDHRFGSANGDAGGAADGPAMAVECRRLDAYVEAGEIDPAAVGLVWIDAQGHEPHVLRGARSLLGAGVPMVIEYCPWLLNDAAAELDETVTRHYSTILNLRVLADGGAGARVLPDGLAALGRQYARRGYADLLLLP